MDSAFAVDDISAMYTVITRSEPADKDCVSACVTACLVRPDFDYSWISWFQEHRMFSVSLFDRFFVASKERENNIQPFTNTYRERCVFSSCVGSLCVSWLCKQT